MASTPAAPARRLYPRLLSAGAVNAAMLVLVPLFLLQHPLLPSLSGLRPALAAAGAQLAVALRLLASGDSAARRELQRFLFGYLLGDELGAHGRRDFYELNEWKNSLVLPASLRAALPHVAAVWLRNYAAIHVVYFGLAGGWALVLYVLMRDTFFPVVDAATGARNTPSAASLWAQAKVSMLAMPVYVMVPTLCEWVVERGLTRAVGSFAEAGGIDHWLLSSCAYLFFVEWAIYWIHRGLHEVRWLYKWLHEDHHIYNNSHDMSPLAGLAFHPLDGALQASPYFVGLFLLPVHFWTHTALLFFTGVWTASIHDALQTASEPIMGSKYHMYHHTAYRDNYGQFFVFFDWLHDTLTDPLLKDASKYGKPVAGLDDPVGMALSEAAARSKAD